MNSENSICISLGFNCLPAMHAVKTGLRKTKKEGYNTCVFDLMDGNYGGLIECLKEDFQDFCNPEQLTFIKMNQEEWIYNKKYRFAFVHESNHADLPLKEGWSSPTMFSENNFAKFIERYDRRINNFRNYLNSGNFIHFILNFPICDISELKETITHAYPNLKYKIEILQLNPTDYYIKPLINLGFNINEREYIIAKYYQETGKVLSISNNFDQYKFIIYTHNPYHESNGGVMVMYYLAYCLNKNGFYTKICSADSNNTTNVIYNEFISLNEANSSFYNDNKTIVIYSEGSPNNPLNKNKVIRWMLSEIGLNVPAYSIGGWGKKELVYFFCSEVRFKNWPTSINRIYKTLNLLYLNPIFLNVESKNERKEYCHTFRKHWVHKEIRQIHPVDSFEIHKSLTNEELKQIFTSYKYFVSYDPITYINVLAALCGCISIVYPIEGCNKMSWLQKTHAWEYLKENNLGTNYYGIAYGLEEIEYAKNTMHLVQKQQNEINDFIAKKSVRLLTNDILNWDMNENTISNVYYSKVSVLQLTVNKIKRCIYGFNQGKCDVTDIIINYLNEKRYYINVNDEYMKSDPHPGREKKLFIETENELFEVYQNDYLIIDYGDKVFSQKNFYCNAKDMSGYLIFQILEFKKKYNQIDLYSQFETFISFYSYPQDHFIVRNNENEIISYAIVRQNSSYNIIEDYGLNDELINFICSKYECQPLIIKCKKENIDLLTSYGFKLTSNIIFSDIITNDYVMIKNLIIHAKWKITHRKEIKNEMMNTRIIRKDLYSIDDIQGVARLCDWFISAEQFINISNTDTPKLIFISGMSGAKSISYFVEKILPSIQNKVNIIIASEDNTFPYGRGDVRGNFYFSCQHNIANMLNSPHIDKIFVENLDYNNDRYYPIPLGFMYHNGELNCNSLAKEYSQIVEENIDFEKKKNLVLSCQRVRSDAQFYKRRLVRSYSQNEWKEFVTYQENLNESEFFEILKDTKFVLCVQGGGYDPCPRFWQALMCNCIPIIEHSPLDAAFERFPVVFIDSWNEKTISIELLKEWENKLKPHYIEKDKREKVLNMLRIEYWSDIFSNKIDYYTEKLGLTTPLSKIVKKNKIVFCYGLDGVQRDVTYLVYQNFIDIDDHKLFIPKNINFNVVFGDPYPQHAKKFTIYYENKKKIYEETRNEDIEFEW